MPELRPRGIGEILDAAVLAVPGPLRAARAGRGDRRRPGAGAHRRSCCSRPSPTSFTVELTGDATPQLRQHTDRGAARARSSSCSSSASSSTAFIVGGDARGSSPTRTSATPDDGRDADGTSGRRVLRRRSGVSARRRRVGELVGLLALLRRRARAAQRCFAVAIPVLILERHRRVPAARPLGRRSTKAHFWHVLGVVLTAQLLATVLNFALAAGLSSGRPVGDSATAAVHRAGRRATAIAARAHDAVRRPPRSSPSTSTCASATRRSTCRW